jgi:integrase
MMSYKIILRMNKTNSIGRAPLVLQLIYKRRSTEISLKKYLEPSHWDFKKCVVKKSYHNHNTLNLYLRSKTRRIEQIIDRRLYEATEFTLADVVNEFKGIKPGATSITFSDYFEQHINSCAGKLKFGSLQNFKVAKRKWDEIHKGVLLKDVNKSHIEKLEKYLLDKYQLKPNTLQKRMSNIRTICLKAIREELLKKNPFDGLVYKKERANRESLTASEVDLIDNLEDLTVAQDLARDVFLFSCYTGLRYGDICTLKYSDLDDEKLDGKVYRVIIKKANKTGNKLFIPLKEEAIRIIDKYNGINKPFVFPLIEEGKVQNERGLKVSISRSNAVANKHIKKVAQFGGIDKNVSMHIGRITFASLLASDSSMPVTFIRDLLGHSDIRTTQIYLKPDRSNIIKTLTS